MSYSHDQIKSNRIGKSIVILICYFGEFPWYFDYFLHSCKYNPTVHFIIITDDEAYSKTLPENIIIINKSMAELNDLASEKLGFKTHINNTRKLCDFKPAYGFLFSDLIRDYDFWGHGDIDVIYGDIRNFITHELLDTYELINVRSDYLAGYFLLFENNQKMNTLFMESKDYQKVLSSDIHYCFDETNFKFIEFFDGLPYRDIKSEVESMTHVVKKLHNENYIRAYFDLHAIERLTGNITWNKGQLIYKDEYEILLYHLKHLKTKYNPGKTPKKIPDTFHIGQSRIYH